MTADTILVDRVPGETRVAALAGGRLVDLHVARGDPRWAVGAIHLGRVAQVVAAFAGAFVDIGLEQAAFLRLADVPQPPQPGDPLIVQIVRATAGEKGLGVTARPRLAGQLMDWTSGRPGLRMPRGGAVTPPGLAAGEGADLRPAAVAADPEALAAEAAALRAQWQRIEAQAARGVAPAPLAPAPEPWMPLALHHAATLTAIRFADRASAAAARAAVAGRLPEIAGLLAQDAAGWRLFDEAGVEEQIAAALMRRVKLPRGGALTIDEAEAATLIDVDAEESRAAPPALNRAAVPAVAAALRLRGIGGQVLVDFVRGGGAKDRDAVVAALRAAVADDPEPVEIAGWSRLGLLELTRRRSRPSLASLLAAPMSDRPAAVVARAYDALRAAARTGAGAGVSTVAITAGREVADALTGPLAEDLAALAAAAAVRLDVVRDPTLGPTDFRAAPSRPQGGRE